MYNKKSENLFFHTIYEGYVEKERTDMVVRAFEVRATKEQQVADLGRKLDCELIRLQKNGWNIKSVTATPCKELDYPDYFASTLFTISTFF